VHAGKVVMRLFGIAGMVVHLGADVLRQVVQLIAAAPATGGAATARRGFSRILTDYLQFHHSASQALPRWGITVFLMAEMQVSCLNLIQAQLIEYKLIFPTRDEPCRIGDKTIRLLCWLLYSVLGDHARFFTM
jgi:hypothetical protein